MTVNSQQNIQIKESFSKMKEKEDFLALLNDVKPLIFGKKAVPFELKQLTWYGNPKLGGERYHNFKIKKKSGGEREIHAPVNGLLAIQKCIALVLQCVFAAHPSASGFVWGKSVVENAKFHIGQRYVYNLDLKDFFPSINQARVWKCLQLNPFNLNRDETLSLLNESTPDIDVKSSLDDRLGIANLIAAISCVEMEVERMSENKEWVKIKSSVLPQGAPTSPVITNIVCQRLDFILTGVAKRFGLRYSRYADDITFSSNHNVYKNGSDFLLELNRVILDQGFHIKESKTRLQGDGYRQEVTGLIVNEKVNVPKRYIKQLRMWLYYWERYGFFRAKQFFLQSYSNDKGHIKTTGTDMAKVIEGKLNYLKMVRGSEDLLYQNLLKRFRDLVDSPLVKTSRTDHLNQVMEVFMKSGLEKALDIYNPLKADG